MDQVVVNLPQLGEGVADGLYMPLEIQQVNSLVFPNWTVHTLIERSECRAPGYMIKISLYI